MTLACVAVAGCNTAKPPSNAEIDRRIVRALPVGWHLTRSSDDAVPYGIQLNTASPAGREIVLTGPVEMRVAGYYCDGSYCTRQAREAIEVWIMPANFEDDSMPALQAWRIPESIAPGHGMRVFALASREMGAPGDFDYGYTGSSTESVKWASREDGDLPVSWKSWKTDIGRAVWGDTPLTAKAGSSR